MSPTNWHLPSTTTGLPWMAQWVKNLPSVLETQKTRVQSLGQEEALEEEMAAHFSVLAWRTPRTEEPGGLRITESQRVRHDWVTKRIHSHLWLQGLNHVLLQLLTLNSPGKVFRVETGNEVLRSGKTGRTDFRRLDNFSRFYELNSCISMHLEKHWNPSWWWLFLLTSKSFTTLAETFWKNMCLIVCTPPSPKSHAHWPSVPASLEQFLTAIWDAVSQAIVLILPQIKVNSQVSHCAFFFSQQLWIPSNLSVDLVESYSYRPGFLRMMVHPHTRMLPSLSTPHIFLKILSNVMCANSVFSKNKFWSKGTIKAL